MAVPPTPAPPVGPRPPREPYGGVRSFLLGVIVSLFFCNMLMMSKYMWLYEEREPLSSLSPSDDVDNWSRLDYVRLTEGHHRGDKSTTEMNCPIADPVAKSALERMQTEHCRKRMRRLACSRYHRYHREPGVPNTCAAYFNESTQYQLVGCFRDSAADRILGGHAYSMPFTNSIEHCVQTCLNAGFTHAGVEFRTECHCGDLKGAKHETRRLRDSQCDQMRCPSNPGQFCGGFASVAVYTTGIQGGDHSSRWPVFVPLQPHADEQNAAGYLWSKKPLVRILFLLQLNGRNIRQVKRMLRMLYSPDHLYYVHVDPTQNYMLREMQKIQRNIEVANGAQNFHVAPTANNQMIWGGTKFGQSFGFQKRYLDMVLTAINRTLSSSDFSKWDYLINLSETDMPVLPMADLEHNLYLKKGISFMTSTGAKSDKFIDRQGLRYYFLECEGRMWKVMRRESFPENLRLDGGLDWLVLHRDLAEFALLPDPDPLPAQLRALFASVLLPMEGFWQTLALNSHFCERILYRNLRSVNWPISQQQRTSYCRCEVWKKYVDWCGCWPLVFRADDPRLNAGHFRKEFAFFGRKFDALIDVDAIAKIEQIVAGGRSNSSSIASSSPVFNATWINLYDHEADANNTAPNQLRLLTRFARCMIGPTLWESHSRCTVARLLDNVLYKANVTATVMAVMGIELNCGDKQKPQVELLIALANSTVSIDESTNLTTRVRYSGQHFVLDGGPEFGIGFDPKYELFRAFPPVVDLSLHNASDSKLTILWRWQTDQTTKIASKNSAEKTSPPMDARFFDAEGRMVRRRTVPAYDSVEGKQYIAFGLDVLREQRQEGVEKEHMNMGNNGTRDKKMVLLVLPGTYTLRLFPMEGEAGDHDQQPLFSIEFPIFPTSDMALFDQLAQRHFELKGICRMANSNYTAIPGNWPECGQTEWSSTRRDEKAEFY